MKLILIGLVLLNLTALSQPSTGDSTYCLPLSKARLLISDALRLRASDTIMENLSKRVVLLETEKAATYLSFTNLLKIEQEKFQLQKEITDHTSKLSESYREQLAYITKKERKQRIQNRFLKAGVTAAAIFIGYQAVK